MRTLRACLLSLLLAAPLAAQPLTPRDSAIHVLNRLAYGPAPGQLDLVLREGVLRWVDRQLGVSGVEDPSLAGTLARYELIGTPSAELARSFVMVQQQRRQAQRAAGRDSMMAPSRPRPEEDRSPEAQRMRRLFGQLQELVLVRAVGSERQLAEVMADFWNNHFNVFLGKPQARPFVPGYVEEVLRPRALGRFEELVLATARAPAMLSYLDNAQSIAPGAQPPLPPRLLRRAEVAQRRPTGLNENYARELLELHTLGVDGGYTQQDVTEVARILTGWSVQPPQRGGGGFVFNAWAHDRGAKTVLGVAYPAGGGEEEGVRLIQALARHPSTMHYLSGKLCARFVSDTPPDGCIDNAVRAWKRSHGEIREVLRAILHSPDFWARANQGSKIKTPLEFVASAVRAVGGTPDTTPRLAAAVGRLGQPLYQHQAPDGYGEREEEWVNSGALLSRMNLAVALAANRLPGVGVDLDRVIPVEADLDRLVESVNQAVLAGRMTAQTRAVIRKEIAELRDPAAARALAVGLALGGPEFQRQ